MLYTVLPSPPTTDHGRMDGRMRPSRSGPGPPASGTRGEVPAGARLTCSCSPRRATEARQGEGEGEGKPECKCRGALVSHALRLWADGSTASTSDSRERNSGAASSADLIRDGLCGSQGPLSRNGRRLRCVFVMNPSPVERMRVRIDRLSSCALGCEEEGFVVNFELVSQR